MDVFISIVVFIITLLLYVHITNQFKKGSDMEVYEMDYKDNEELQKVCELKQPFIFPLATNINKIITIEYLQHYEKEYVRVKDTNDYFGSQSIIGETYIPFSSFYILMKTDTKSHYFIENNDEFMEETGLNSIIDKELNIFLNPKYSIVVQRKYDICMGSKNVELPLRYHTNFRHYYMVLHGKIHIKMTPFKNSVHLDPVNDFNIYENYSTFNIWKTNKENVPTLEFDVLEGQVFYVPPYWWYSIKYSNIEDTMLCSCTYHSLTNIVAHSPELVKYYIHQQNLEKKYMKTLETNKELPNESFTENPSIQEEEHVNLPSQSTVNWSSSTLRTEESLIFPSHDTAI